jgi:hypothetical protein
MRSEVLRAATDFWYTAPCSLTEVYRRFKGAYGLHHQLME